MPFLKKDISLPAKRGEYLKPNEDLSYDKNTTHSRGNLDVALYSGDITVHCPCIFDDNDYGGF